MKKLKYLVLLFLTVFFISCQELPPEAFLIEKYKITGTVDIDPKIKDKCTEGTLYIIVRQGASIQPLAVKKYSKLEFPKEFKVLPSDVLMENRIEEFFEGDLIIMARISKSGSPMPQKGDCESPAVMINPGEKNVKLTINSIKE
ncbi:MAG: hypothetical protein GXO22_01370 [Aquificae bacterium]|nr:hypothetical protein [Aquificota bacterium]